MQNNIHFIQAIKAYIFTRPFQRAIIILILALFVSFSQSSYAGKILRPWVLIDTTENKIALMKGLNALKTFENVSIGRNGASIDRSEGDKTTPIGEFEIAWISDSRKYHKFFGISYPTLPQARAALDENRISTKSFSRIKKALDAGRLPPQDTELGGNLGIHGIGSGDRTIHNSFNWTNGCVAMTDEQVDELGKFIRIGTPVIIR